VKRWYEFVPVVLFQVYCMCSFHAQVGRRQWFNMVYRWCDVVWELMLPTGKQEEPP
jgi:hypothetical protein